MTLGRLDRTSIVFFYYPSFESEMIGGGGGGGSSGPDFEYNYCEKEMKETPEAEAETTTRTFGEWIAAKWEAVKN